MSFNNKTTQKGVSLIEMLTAVTIFILTIGAISGIFVSTLRNQRRILATQEVLDQASFVVEYISRALRMAKKDTAGTCLTTGYNYENPGGDTSQIKFIKFEQATNSDVCYHFYLNNNRIYESKNGGAGVALTSEKIQVNSLKFNLSGQSEIDTLQPRITIFLEILGRGSTGEKPKIKIQTSISQRNLDI